MSIQISVKQFSDAQVRFSYSVLHELLISLHVLEDYRAYPLHLNWSLRTLRSLPPDLQAEREYFHVLLSTLIYCLLDVHIMASATFADELQTFAEQPLDEFTTPILSRLLLAQPPGGKTILENKTTVEQMRRDSFLQDKARGWLLTYFPNSALFFDDLLAHPQQFKTRFVTFIENYWTCIFADFWRDNEGHFLHDIADKGRILMTDGVLHVLDSISPKIKIQPDVQQATYVSTGIEDSFRLDDDDILNLHPSYFTYPMIGLSVRGDKDKAVRLSITYPLSAVYDISHSPVLADELLDIVSAISDPTRLKILRLVAQQPRSTKEIAGILNLSDAAISKHLQVLRTGGWVTSERNSYYVMYRATKTPLSSLNRGIEDIFV